MVNATQIALPSNSTNTMLKLVEYVNSEAVITVEGLFAGFVLVAVWCIFYFALGGFRKQYAFVAANFVVMIISLMFWALDLINGYIPMLAGVLWLGSVVMLFFTSN